MGILDKFKKDKKPIDPDAELVNFFETGKATPHNILSIDGGLQETNSIMTRLNDLRPSIYKPLKELLIADNEKIKFCIASQYSPHAAETLARKGHAYFGKSIEFSLPYDRNPAEQTDRALVEQLHGIVDWLNRTHPETRKDWQGNIPKGEIPQHRHQPIERANASALSYDTFVGDHPEFSEAIMSLGKLNDIQSKNPKKKFSDGELDEHLDKVNDSLNAIRNCERKNYVHLYQIANKDAASQSSTRAASKALVRFFDRRGDIPNDLENSFFDKNSPYVHLPDDVQSSIVESANGIHQALSLSNMDERRKKLETSYAGLAKKVQSLDKQGYDQLHEAYQQDHHPVRDFARTALFRSFIAVRESQGDGQDIAKHLSSKVLLEDLKGWGSQKTSTPYAHLSDSLQSSIAHHTGNIREALTTTSADNRFEKIQEQYTGFAKHLTSLEQPEFDRLHEASTLRTTPENSMNQAIVARCCEAANAARNGQNMEQHLARADIQNDLSEFFTRRIDFAIPSTTKHAPPRTR